MSTTVEKPTETAIFGDTGPAFVDHFHREGFALLRDALSAAEVAEINTDALRLCRDDYGPMDQQPNTDAKATDDEILRRYLPP